MQLCCPKCHAPLDTTDGALHCAHCVVRWPVRDGVACFVDHDDAFYEARFTDTHPAEEPETPLGRFLLPWRLAFSLDLHFNRLIRSFLKTRHREILDVGCGGGHAELKRRGARVAGVDLSLASLRQAAGIYDCVARAPADRLPFADGSFDAVVSADFLGHIPREGKDAVLAECRRVLRPGGVMLHQMETDSEGALFRFARQDPDYFRKTLIDVDGHLGLELPSDAIERFERRGFRVLWAQAEYFWYFFPIGEGRKRFGDTYSQTNPWLRGLLRLDQITTERPAARKAVHLLGGMLNAAVRLVTPMDRGMGLCIALERED